MARRRLSRSALIAGLALMACGGFIAAVMFGAMTGAVDTVRPAAMRPDEYAAFLFLGAFLGTGAAGIGLAAVVSAFKGGR